jgi:putative ABC transport system permease protein
VAILDSNAVETLMPGEDPVGKTIEINQEPYTVVGVVRQADAYQPTIESIDDFYSSYESVIGTVMIPESCWPLSFQFDEAQNVVIKADSTDNMSSAGKAAQDVLNTVVDSENTKFQYKANDITETVKNMQKLSESTSQQLLWIASISLLVGGIGVMNIMLVSVTERTKEIGLKKAIGARKKTILAQFLTEAAILTSIGGIIGVLSGIGLSTIVSKVAGTPSAISVGAIVGSVAFSTLIGVVFGLMPSIKAANLNPIDALRSE